MELTRAIMSRRMVRNYDPDRAPDPAAIDRLLRLAIRAPSAGFSQGWHFLVLTEPEDRAAFWRASSDPTATADSWLRGMTRAPVLILALSDKRVYLDRYAEPDKGWTDRSVQRWPVPYWDVDTGMASMLILLGAVEEGLASCFFGVPTDAVEAVRHRFALAADMNIVGVISLGYPAPDIRSPSLRRGRRELDQVVSYGRVQGSPTASRTGDQDADSAYGSG
jgi:nitroreductase